LLPDLAVLMGDLLDGDFDITEIALELFFVWLVAVSPGTETENFD
jgi:hypothetical protein